MFQTVLRLLVAVLLVIALPAAGQSGPASLRVAAPGFTGLKLTHEERDFFGDYFASKLQSHGGLSVMGRTEVLAQLSPRQQATVADCAQRSGCLRNLSRALGVEGLVLGSIARFDGAYAINVTIVEGATGRTLASHAGRVPSEHAVLPFLEDAALRMAAQAAVAPREAPRMAEVPEQGAWDEDARAEESQGPWEDDRTGEDGTSYGASADDEALSRAEAAELDRAERRAAVRRARREEVLSHRERLALKRNLLRVDVSYAGVGYEFRVAPMFRLGGRLRLLGGLSIHSTGGLAYGADATALLRFEPLMSKPFGFSIHAGVAAGGYAWPQRADDSVGRIVIGGAPVLGAEFIVDQVWRIGAEMILFPAYASWQSGSSAIYSLSFGRAFIF